MRSTTNISHPKFFTGWAVARVELSATRLVNPTYPAITKFTDFVQLNDYRLPT